jgi:uncharacterized protein DUF4232
MTDQVLRKTMRKRLRFYAASTTVLAACSLVLTGCGPKDDSGAGTPAASTSSKAGPGSGAGGSTDGAGKGDQGTGTAGNGGSTGGGNGNHKPDAPACTEKNTAITIRTSVGSGDGEIQLLNNSGRPCSIVDAPNVVLKSADGEVLNTEPEIDESQEALPLTVDAGGNVATADLTYESGPVSEGGSQDGITCGEAAESAEVSNQDATWQAEIRANKAGDADAVKDGLIVCGPKTTVGPFHQ